MAGSQVTPGKLPTESAASSPHRKSQESQNNWTGATYPFPEMMEFSSFRTKYNALKACPWEDVPQKNKGPIDAKKLTTGRQLCAQAKASDNYYAL